MEVPIGLYEVEIGKANIVKDGSDVTLVAWSGMVPTALEAAETINNDGISVEVIDLRSIFPIDEETILKSVEKNI